MIKNAMSLKAKINNIAKKRKSITSSSNANLYAGKIIRKNIYFRI